MTTAPQPAEQPAVGPNGLPLRCSACGSTAPHHVAYVAEHGVCVI